VDDGVVGAAEDAGMTHIQIQRTGIAAVAAVAVALVFANIVGNSEAENGGVGFYVVSVVVCAALAYFLFGRVVPRTVAAEDDVAGKRGVILGVLSLIGATIGFWSGLGYVLGAAAVALGMVQRERGAKGVAIASIVLGVLALLANTAIITMDELSR
jgi:hypothetical protein